MKTIAKKTLCLLLALLMLLPFVVSCKRDGEAEGTDTSVEGAADVSGEESGSETKSKYEVYDNLGDIDLGERTIRIGQPNSDEYMHDIFVDRMTGDVVNDAVYNRNKAVEKRLNCKVEQVLVGSTGADNWVILDDLETNITSGLSYDVLVNAMWTTAARLPRGYYKDLNKLKILTFLRYIGVSILMKLTT